MENDCLTIRRQMYVNLDPVSGTYSPLDSCAAVFRDALLRVVKRAMGDRSGEELGRKDHGCYGRI